MSKRPVLLFCTVLFSFLLQSCATIFHTWKQRVSFDANTDNVEVYVDTDNVGKTPVKKRVLRHGVEVQFKKEGYKTYSEVLYPDKLTFLTYIDMIPLALPAVVDLGTGAAFKLNKRKLHAELVRIPRAPETPQTLSCRKVLVQPKAGDEMGGRYTDEEKSEIIFYGETMDYYTPDLKRNTNTTLRETGFLPEAREGDLISTETQGSYTIVAEISGLNYYNDGYRFFLEDRDYTTCIVDVTWKLYGPEQNMLYSRETTGTSVIYETSSTETLPDAFENALYVFLNDEELHRLLKQDQVVRESFQPSDSIETLTIDRPEALKAEPDRIISQATRSVVTISNKETFGSGCIISESGYIVTNYHVVEGAETVEVSFKGGTVMQGEVIRVNTHSDLALVLVQDSSFQALPIELEKEVNIGSDVYAIGTPADKSLGQTVSKGIISGVRDIEERTWIQTDVSVNPGSSGGALINKQGQLVGVVNAKLVGEGIEGIGFAIPAYTLFDQLNITY